jgi:glycosyltransferase involved in cell wall biosynthesis
MLAPPEAKLKVLVTREARVSVPLPANVELRRGWIRGGAGFYLTAAIVMAAARLTRTRIVVTDRSAVALAGWACRRLGGYRWIVDIWDSPHAELATYYAQGRGLSVRARRLASRLKVATFRRVLKRSDRALVSVHPGALARYDLNSSKVRLFTNAIVLDRLSRSKADDARDPGSVCVVTRRFLRDRGVDVLVEALERLPAARAAGINVRLVGRLPAEIEAEVRRSSVSRRFEILGEVPSAEAHRLMSRTEIGLAMHAANSDLSFRYPVKVLEYMALGCVVVASDLPGIREIVEHERHGLLVTPGDPVGLAAALERLIGDEHLRRELRERAYEHVKGFDARKKARAIYAAINEE